MGSATESARSRTAFVGRRAEIERLETVWAAVEDDRRQVVFVGGEPGVGKTRLVVEAAAALREHGATVLRGACREDFNTPYRPFVDILEQALGQLPPEASGDITAQAAAPLLRLTNAVLGPGRRPRACRPATATPGRSSSTRSCACCWRWLSRNRRCWSSRISTGPRSQHWRCCPIWSSRRRESSFSSWPPAGPLPRTGRTPSASPSRTCTASTGSPGSTWSVWPPRTWPSTSSEQPGSRSAQPGPPPPCCATTPGGTPSSSRSTGTTSSRGAVWPPYAPGTRRPRGRCRTRWPVDLRRSTSPTSESSSWLRLPETSSIPPSWSRRPISTRTRSSRGLTSRFVPGYWSRASMPTVTGSHIRWPARRCSTGWRPPTSRRRTPASRRCSRVTWARTTRAWWRNLRTTTSRHGLSDTRTRPSTTWCSQPSRQSAASPTAKQRPCTSGRRSSTSPRAHRGWSCSPLPPAATCTPVTSRRPGRSTRT